MEHDCRILRSRVGCKNFTSPKVLPWVFHSFQRNNGELKIKLVNLKKSVLVQTQNAFEEKKNSSQALTLKECIWERKRKIFSSSFMKTRVCYILIGWDSFFLGVGLKMRSINKLFVFLLYFVVSNSCNLPLLLLKLNKQLIHKYIIIINTHNWFSIK